MSDDVAQVVQDTPVEAPTEAPPQPETPDQGDEPKTQKTPKRVKSQAKSKKAQAQPRINGKFAPKEPPAEDTVPDKQPPKKQKKVVNADKPKVEAVEDLNYAADSMGSMSRADMEKKWAAEQARRLGVEPEEEPEEAESEETGTTPEPEPETEEDPEEKDQEEPEAEEEPEEEPEPETPEQEPEPEPPQELIFGKYKSVADAEKAYKASEQRMHEATNAAKTAAQQAETIKQEHQRALEWIQKAETFFEQYKEQADQPQRPQEPAPDMFEDQERYTTWLANRAAMEAEHKVAERLAAFEKQNKELQQRIAQREELSRYDAAESYFKTAHKDIAHLGDGLGLVMANYIASPEGLTHFQQNHRAAVDKMAIIARNHPEVAFGMAVDAARNTPGGQAEFMRDPDAFIGRIKALFPAGPKKPEAAVKPATPPAKPAPPRETRQPLTGKTHVKPAGAASAKPPPTTLETPAQYIAERRRISEELL